MAFKVDVDEHGDLMLREVYSGVGFRSSGDEFLGVCMRNFGFEVNYGGKWYSFQRGEAPREFGSAEQPKWDTARGGDDG